MYVIWAWVCRAKWTDVEIYDTYSEVEGNMLRIPGVFNSLLDIIADPGVNPHSSVH